MTEYHKVKNRLIVEVYSKEEMYHLKDELLVLAGDIEDALSESGAKPEKDYNYSQLMGWAVQLQSSTRISEAMDRLGLKDASTPMGALELMALEIKEGAKTIADAIISEPEVT